ncbi:hypothetical protein CC86DRAFT_406156 [Ophiobolus disseminans]|uniref:Uncharacterized protein n=1 Tax=Ophiobolus disseminans TaxID=1469910 RepID=A0A6A7A2Y6_9PLEO|nr:hypothetical protein CC86DRAFT_406156 [Ophiobolus disseminans]
MTPPQAQAQQQQRELIFVMKTGQQITLATFRAMMNDASAAQSQGRLTADKSAELMWMLSQHYPTHSILKGRRYDPPPGTVPWVAEQYLARRARLDQIATLRQQHIEQLQILQQPGQAGAGQTTLQPQQRRVVHPYIQPPHIQQQYMQQPYTLQHGQVEARQAALQPQQPRVVQPYSLQQYGQARQASLQQQQGVQQPRAMGQVAQHDGQKPQAQQSRKPLWPNSSEELSVEQIQQLTPRRAKKYAWEKNLRDEAKKQGAPPARAMYPPPRPTSTTHELIDLTGGSKREVTNPTGSSKRKAPPTSETQPKPKRQQVVNDLAVHRATQLRLQNEQPNCGFGSNTIVIRSNPSSRQPSPHPSHPPISQNIHNGLIIGSPAPSDISPAPDFHTPAYVKLSDLDLSGNSQSMEAQRALNLAEIARLRSLLDPQKIRQAEAFPFLGPHQSANAQSIYNNTLDPAVAAAYERVRSGTYDFSFGDGHVQPQAAETADTLGYHRQADGTLRADDPGMSETQADLMWELQKATARG